MRMELWMDEIHFAPKKSRSSSPPVLEVRIRVPFFSVVYFSSGVMMIIGMIIGIVIKILGLWDDDPTITMIKTT